MHPERHPDDLPPPEEEGLTDPNRRRIPRGLGWAVALAVITIAIMAVIGLEGDDTGEMPDRLDDRIIMPSDGEPPVALAGDQIPDLSFEDFDGRPSTLDDYLGRPLVLNLWASWCAPCLREMPDFEEVFRERQGSVAFVGLNISDGIEPALRMAEQTGVTYDLVRDEDGGAATELGVVDMPTTVFIYPDGQVAEVRSGAMDADELRERLEVIAGEPPEDPEP